MTIMMMMVVSTIVMMTTTSSTAMSANSSMAATTTTMIMDRERRAPHTRYTGSNGKASPSEVRYIPDWSRSYRDIYGYPLAHLEIEAIELANLHCR